MLSRNVTFDVMHAMFRNFTITATGSYQTNNYQGADTFEQVGTAGVKLEYKLTRSIAIKGSYFWQRLVSSSANSNFTANVIMGGLRFEPYARRPSTSATPLRRRRNVRKRRGRHCERREAIQSLEAPLASPLRPRKTAPGIRAAQ